MMIMLMDVYRVFLLRSVCGIKLLFVYCVFLLLCVPAQAESEKTTCLDCWSPNLLFDIEDGGIEQTMVFISGYGYGLNSSNKVLIAEGRENYFCNGGKVIDSQELVEILNENLNGQVTAEQVSSVITFGLMKKYPCNEKFL